jgi:hypothetical protein
MSLERSLGSVAFAHLMLLLVVLGDAAFVFFSFVAAFGPARYEISNFGFCVVRLI